MKEARENGGDSVVQIQANSEQVPTSNATSSHSTAELATPTTAPATTSWMDVVFKRHMVYDPLMLVFSLFIMILGVIGYETKGSVASLVSSTLFFLVFLLVTHLEGVRRNPIPLILTLTVLSMFMAIRYLKNKEFYPAGLVAVTSLFMLSRHLYMLLARKSLS